MKTTKSLLDKQLAKGAKEIAKYRKAVYGGKVCLFTNGEMVEISKSRKLQWVGGSAKIEVVYSDGSAGFEHIEDLDISKYELENLGFDLNV